MVAADLPGVARGPARWWRLGFIAVPAALVVLWTGLDALVQDAYVLASPAATLGSALDGFRRGWLSSSLLATLQKVMISFLLASVVGVAVGVVLGLRREVEEVVEPLVLAGWATPKSVLYPIFILVFGLGSRSAIFFAAAWGIFPVIMLTTTGLRRVPRSYVKLTRTLGMSPLRRFTKVLAPAISLELVVGLRYCWSLSFLGMIVMEMFGSPSGVGRDLIFYQAVGDMERMLAVAATVVTLTVLMSFAFFLTESRIARHRGVRGQQGLLGR